MRDEKQLGHTLSSACLEADEVMSQAWPTSGGYFHTRRRGSRTLIQAHRLVWEECFGLIPDGLRVLHSCDNPPCVNPEHLFLGTQADNMRDMVEKGRSAQHAGVDNGRAKLTIGDVSQIRTRLAKGEKQVSIASAFGVSQRTICKINRGESWQSV